MLTLACEQYICLLAWPHISAGVTIICILQVRNWGSDPNTELQSRAVGVMFEHGKVGCSDQTPGALVLPFKLSSRHKNALLLKRRKSVERLIQ